MQRDDWKSLAEQLQRETEAEVRFDGASRALYAAGGGNYRQVPIGVVVPRSIDDVIAAMAAARAHGAPILPRGGGTSLAGQCCNVALVIDFSKYLRQIVAVDRRRRVARVQPGVVLDQLRAVTEPMGLTFAPDPSTHAYCTLGGMIANNSCGVHSVMAGRTSDNVEALDVLLYDGTRLQVGAHDGLHGAGREGDIYRALTALRDRYADLIRARYPKIPRRVSGYNLDDLLPENGFQVARALAGTEGTCATVLQATVRLVPWPSARSLLVLGYPSVYEAADHIEEVLKAGPIGCEGMDDVLVGDMKTKNLHVDYLSLLPEGKGWLLVEFGGEDKRESDARARALMEAIGSGKRAPSMKLYDDKAAETHIWKLRESGLGATARISGKPDSWEGWEDSAVHPSRLGEYLRQLRALFDRYQYGCALYGHFGQGCVHTRIDFDLKSRPGVEKFRSFIEDASDLVLRLGGSLSGEHGDGQSRAELLPKMYGAELVQAFREFKAIWDPDGKMNPGKVVDPYRITDNLRLGPNYRPKALQTYFAFTDDKHDFAYATERCVGVGQCRRLEGKTMCPSYRVTLEEQHSTRGRAHLLNEMLRGETVTGGWQDEGVKEALDLCLSCKGCKGDCPVNVDLAAYKSEFLAHYYEHHRRPMSAYTMGLIYWWARAASHLPRTANFALHAPGIARVAKRLGGIHPARDLPRFATTNFRKWWRKRPLRNEGKPQVLLWVDTFNNFFHPETAAAAVEVLEAAGRQVIVPAQTLCCGRPLYDYGFLKKARELLQHTLGSLRKEIALGTPLVGLEPSCLSVFRDEMVQLLPNDADAARLKQQSFLLSEFLEQVKWHPPPLHRKAVVHGHCHHKAVVKMNEEEAQLAHLGLDYELLDAGCCGMAGAFGFEREHYQISQAIGEKELLPAVRQAGEETIVIADGFSCREQIRQNSQREAVHFAEVVQLALHPERAPARVRPERSKAARPWVPAPASLALLFLVAALLTALWMR